MRDKVIQNRGVNYVTFRLQVNAFTYIIISKHKDVHKLIKNAFIKAKEL
ncbi:hypothetical protein GCM10007971_18030 [Oceanobacillus indicireducens]|uniref:Uncharacterized protein n=1 Tax=Oceanobacillus indicireducens TaxID=1004261 RepID=A0A917XWQ3_9BACI|nr:hypothetical protein GCM10007971_18030 [Oceanobacillus indicireducens]